MSDTDQPPFYSYQRIWLQREMDKLHKRIDELRDHPKPPEPPAEPPSAA